MIAILGIGLRAAPARYTTDPAPLANFDGVNWAWNGQAPVVAPHDGGVVIPAEPITTSSPSPFEHTGIYLPGVSLQCDHPPLFGRLVGGVAVLAGERTPDQLTEA